MSSLSTQEAVSLKSALNLCIDIVQPKQPNGISVWFRACFALATIMKKSLCPGLLLGTEAPVMTPNSVDFLFFLSHCV